MSAVRVSGAPGLWRHGFWRGGFCGFPASHVFGDAAPSNLSAEGLAALGARNICDREPIHLSSAIQPHGFLLVVDPESLVIIGASANFPTLPGPDTSPLGVGLGTVLGMETAQTVLRMHKTSNPHDALPTRVRLPQAARNLPYDMIMHRSGTVLVLEFEASSEIEDVAFTAFFHRQRSTVRALLTLDTVAEICQFTVREVRQLTGFDRVMIYRFEPDAHGCVIAEDCREGARPFLGLHFPAADISRQARVIYMRNWIRLITDIGYTPVPIVTLPDRLAVDQLDLSMSVLRSVSPRHLEYLRNMRVGATMTISLIVDNQLWGMIACHQDIPRHVSHMQRLAYEALGQLVSVRLRAADAAKHVEQVRNLGQMAAHVITAMAAAEHPAAGATSAAEPLLNMVAADGAVIEINGLRVSVGKVPGVEILDQVVSRLGELASAGAAPLATDALLKLVGIPLGPEGSDASAATGALFLPLPGRVQGFVLWLRGERAETVRWAGRPEAQPDGDYGQDTSLTPRASFEEWLQEVRGYSTPWLACEVAVALELVQAMPELLQHRSQNRLVRLALHDPLTGLPNRVNLLEKLTTLLGTPAPLSVMHNSGVLYFDIDGFKAVNDTRGHLAGDELLTLAARRVSALIRPQEIVARMGGDEFVLLLPNAGMREAVSVGQRIVEDFRRPFLLGGEAHVSVTLSIGVAIVTSGIEPGEALRQADSAMYHAKRSGRDQVAVYDPASGIAASRRKLETDQLRHAIEAGQITTYYQPILELRPNDGLSVHGFEALARWQHPTRGLVPPDEFINLAEQTGLIGSLGDAVMSQALRQLQAWPDRRLTMAVNVSVRQLLRADFATTVLDRLLQLGIEPGRLSLEVTESQMMEQPELALAALAKLAAVGVGIGIDDFGTGFSSMSYLRDLPATVLKIDRSFVAGLPQNPKSVAVVAGTIQLAHSLGMRTVAEGVETAEQLAALRELGSDFVQGYLFGKPSPAEAVTLKYEPVTADFSTPLDPMS